MKKLGNRIEVMKGTAEMTGGGLKKKDLIYNKNGKIISKKMNKKKYKQIGGVHEVCKVLAYAVYNVHVLGKAANRKLNISNANDSTVLEYITKKKEIGGHDSTNIEFPEVISNINIPFKKKHLSIEDISGDLDIKISRLRTEKRSFIIKEHYLTYTKVNSPSTSVEFHRDEVKIDLYSIKQISISSYRRSKKFSLTLSNKKVIELYATNNKEGWESFFSNLQENIQEINNQQLEELKELDESYSYYYYTLLYYTIDTAFYKDYEYIINRYIVMQYNRHLTTISNNNNNNLLPKLSKSLKNIFIYKDTKRKLEIAKFFFNFIGEIDEINIIKVLKIYYLQKYNESKKIKEAEKNFITQKMVIKKETSIEQVYKPTNFRKEEKESTKTTIFTDKDHLSYKVDLTISKFVKTGNIYDIGTLTVIRKTIISHRNEYIVINNPNIFRSKLCKIEITDT